MVVIAGHELVGNRASGRVGQLVADELLPLWTRLTTAIVKQGFAIEYRDLEPPRTGIFDGRRIVIDPDVDFEMQCFILLHLFGHSVQWVAPSIEHQLDALQHTVDKTRFMQVLHDYEFDAARYALTLLHEAGVRHLDQWFADFVATDWCYVKRYYETDQIPPWADCLQCGCPPIEALPIPPLVHRQVEVRFAF
jgi:hypothetical protein